MVVRRVLDPLGDEGLILAMVGRDATRSAQSFACDFPCVVVVGL